ncbi:MAG TPA: GDSL-type esterase/lipase family protein [Puia sp.]|jgi:lysophospholipase L1-like esterase|nr:GDSL-type esterase/lipase family protein [Puia sp.]
MMKILKSLLLVVGILFTSHCLAQPFADEIQEFKKQDKINLPPSNSILFVGSSSFRKWTDVSNYFPGFTIINRGFGGSTLPDVIFYAPEIIFPYHPKQVVIYCGDNDLAASDAITADTVFERFRVLFEMIRKNLPGENILFVSIKPSPSRIRLKEKMEKANLLIQTYLSLQQHAGFVDVYHKMLNTDGSVMTDIFLEDNLHMNAKGYAIWQKVITPYLLK